MKRNPTQTHQRHDTHAAAQRAAVRFAAATLGFAQLGQQVFDREGLIVEPTGEHLAEAATVVEGRGPH